MTSKKRFVWTYSPRNYLKQEDGGSGSLQIDNGQAAIELELALNDAIESRIAATSVELTARLDAVALTTLEPYELSGPGHYTVAEDGSTSADLVIASATHAHTCDTITWGAEYPLQRDQERLTMLLAKWNTDSILKRCMRGWRDSFRHPEHSLIHLYEVCDALRDYFHPFKTHEKEKINITICRELQLESDLDSFCTLCNNDPVTEGRHRGKRDGLGKATEAEISSARSTAKELIDAYLNYLDKTNTAPER